jgi:hypothetical protein
METAARTRLDESMRVLSLGARAVVLVCGVAVGALVALLMLATL